jgi:hypothetical protein
MPTLLTNIKMVGQPLLRSIKRRIKKARKQKKKMKVSTARMKVQRGIEHLLQEPLRLEKREKLKKTLNEWE